MMTKREIDNWLTQRWIKNFHINDDLTVDVADDVDLRTKQLTLLPFQFGVVQGFFDVEHNKLTTLKGCPRKVGKYLSCVGNPITSFEHFPASISENGVGTAASGIGLHFGSTLITSLVGIQDTIKIVPMI